MGWANCGKDSRGRNIGYAFTAKCDKRGCKIKIDRGLAYACGDMHGSGEFDCEGYFCYKHLVYGAHPKQLCEKCSDAWDAAHPEEVAAANKKWNEMVARIESEIQPATA